MIQSDFLKYTKPGQITDSDHPIIIQKAHKETASFESLEEKAIHLYYIVRDQIRYNPYKIHLSAEKLKASETLLRPEGNCVEKSNVYAALLRSIGVPARLGYGIVKNHLATSGIEKVLGTNLLVFHGFVELYLYDKWVKATPVFNIELCHKLNVAPLNFDGKTDSIFQESDKEGNPFMEYVHFYGHFHDLPYITFKEELIKYYPSIINATQNTPFLIEM